MGRRELDIKILTLEKLDAGYFPNMDFNDVPDGGSPDCRHVFYRRSALRVFPGMDLLNSSAAATTYGSGLHYININGVQKRVAVFGTKFYEDVSGTWTDRTGAITISSGDLVQFLDHQQNANKYVIGVPGGGNAPFKWTGSGNAAVLGGSPPNFTTIAKYHNAIFGAVDENVYWSDTSDPETWDTAKWIKPFEKDVKCLVSHGPKLAVLMEDHIGSIQGYDYLDYEAEEKEITTFGCVGKHAAKNCFWGESDLKVIATVAKDGVWVFDEAFGTNKILGDNHFKDTFNQSYLYKSSMAYWRDENLLFIALPAGSSTEPNYLIIVNTKTGAWWPGPSIHADYIRALASMKDDSGNEFIYFVDSSGFAYKFNMDTKLYRSGSTQTVIDYFWKSKRIDLKAVHLFGELVMLADAVGDWSVNVGVNFGLEKSDGSPGSISMKNFGDVLTYTFVLGASTLGGSDYIFSELGGVSGFGRFLQIVISRIDLGTTVTDQSFRIKMMELHLHDMRRGGNDR